MSIFVILGHLATTGVTFPADQAIILAIHGRASPELTRFMRGVTELSSTFVVGPVCFVEAYVLFRGGHRLAAVILVVAIATTPIVVFGSKIAFARPRPEIIPRLVDVLGFGYPSGHTTAATVAYGFGALILAPRPRICWQRWVIAAVAISLIVLVALSRVYLGVHYPSDVVGGVILGTSWLSLWDGVLMISYPIRSGRPPRDAPRAAQRNPDRLDRGGAVDEDVAVELL